MFRLQQFLMAGNCEKYSILQLNKDVIEKVKDLDREKNAFNKVNCTKSFPVCLPLSILLNNICDEFLALINWGFTR